MKSEFRNNAIRGPINSWILFITANIFDWLLGNSKTLLFQNHQDLIVEIRSGAGANMRYFRKKTHLIAIEPNIHMHSNLIKSAKKYGIHLEIKSLVGEAIDLPDNSCEFVVGTFVLCCVNDMQQCLQEIKRILKPSGKFVFIEHVKAREGTILSWIQNMVHRPCIGYLKGVIQIET